MNAVTSDINIAKRLGGIEPFLGVNQRPKIPKHNTSSNMARCIKSTGMDQYRRNVSTATQFLNAPNCDVSAVYARERNSGAHGSVLASYTTHMLRTKSVTPSTNSIIPVAAALEPAAPIVDRPPVSITSAPIIIASPTLPVNMTESEAGVASPMQLIQNFVLHEKFGLRKIFGKRENIAISSQSNNPQAMNAALTLRAETEKKRRLAKTAGLLEVFSDSNKKVIMGRVNRN